MRARTWIATLSATTLALTTAAAAGGLISGATAAGETNSGTPSGSPAGVVTLATTSTGAGTTTVSFTNAAGTKSTVIQTLSTAKDKCSLASAVTTGGSPYLSFVGKSTTGSGAAASFLKNGIGVLASNNATGTACGQVNKNFGESLTVSLNSANPAFASLFGSAKAKSANFDMNLSGNAVIKAVFYRGTVAVGQAELQSGFSAPQPISDIREQLQICNYSSNSGPQSGYNNNCFWKIEPFTVKDDSGTTTNPAGNGGGALVSSTAGGAADFDSVVFTPLVGDFAIQGGAGYPTGSTVGGPTSFTLESFSEGTLNCDSARIATQPGAGGAITNVGITRLVNGAINPATGLPVTCVALPYSLDTTADAATFHKPLTTGQETAQFALKIDRAFATPTNPLAAVKVDWEDGAGSHNVPFCATGVITSIDSATGLPTVDFSKVTTALDQSADALVQYACVYSQSVSIGANGSATASDWVYFTGDIKFPTA
jgi:hypothetical protein